MPGLIGSLMTSEIAMVTGSGHGFLFGRRRPSWQWKEEPRAHATVEVEVGFLLQQQQELEALSVGKIHCSLPTRIQLFEHLDHFSIISPF